MDLYIQHKVSIFPSPQIPLKQTPITLLTISLKILENDVHLVYNFPNNFTLQKDEGELNQRLLEQKLPHESNVEEKQGQDGEIPT